MAELEAVSNALAEAAPSGGKGGGKKGTAKSPGSGGGGVGYVLSRREEVLFEGFGILAQSVCSAVEKTVVALYASTGSNSDEVSRHAKVNI